MRKTRNGRSSGARAPLASLGFMAGRALLRPPGTGEINAPHRARVEGSLEPHKRGHAVGDDPEVAVGRQLAGQSGHRAHDETEHVRAEAKEATLKFEAQVAQTKKLSAEVQRTAAAQAAFAVRAEEKGAQVEDLPRPFALVARAAEEALARNGYAIRVSVKTDQKAVYVTERKVSPPASLEASGFRNQFLIALQIPSASVTRLSVKAEFEKLAQGGRILTAGPDETAEIERRLRSPARAKA